MSSESRSILGKLKMKIPNWLCAVFLGGPMAACSGSDADEVEPASTIEEMCEAYVEPMCENEGVFDYDECIDVWHSVEDDCDSDLGALLACLGEETYFECTDQGPIPVAAMLESGVLAAYCQDQWL